MTAIVELQRVTVGYAKHTALKEVSVVFPPGAVGLLGPNGAGKSTMLKSLLGFLPPSAGTLKVFGLDVATQPQDIRSRIGYMPESDGHMSGMNAVSFVSYCGELAGLPRADAMARAHEVLHYVGLGEARYRNVETYSTGMKQRIKLAQALVHDPDLLFLDEPTNGMDPRGRDEMLALIADLARVKGVNVIVSTHVLPDVEATCGHVVVLDKGRVATQGTIGDLKGPAGRAFDVRIKGEVPAFLAAAAAAGLTVREGDDDLMTVFVPEGACGPGDEPQLIAAAARTAHAQLRHLIPNLPSLDDVFARAIGER